jgi:DnaK suppressor protein
MKMAAARKPPARKAAKPAMKKAVAKKPAKKVAGKKAPVAKKKPVRAAKVIKVAKVTKVAKVAKVMKAAPRVVQPVRVGKTPTRAAPPQARPAPTVSQKSQRSRSVKAAAAVRKEVPMPPLPIPAVSAPKPAPAPSPKDLAAAHEYLLARSATRSEAPVMVNGRRLPTEGELLKMPESAYMNQEQLAFFKHRLQQMERELLQNADETTEHLRETVIVPDPADRATIEEEHALELRTRDRERKLLKKVQQALTRIEAGDYGFCEETGDPIGIPRLLARPTATLSLEAQQRREMKQKMYGD